jgi:UDP-N-acetyl-2-amino-2-deoxyglucuronate dehydrogenase
LPGDLGIGVIGCGAIAPVHAQAVLAAGGARLVALLGRSPERAEALAQRFSVPWTVSLDTFLARPDLDAVLIGTPSGTHAELGVRAAAAGKHVLVEKPIDVTLSRARSLVDACRQHGVRLGVIFQSRCLPAVALLKRAIDDGCLGRLLVVDAYVKWYREPAYYEAARWRGTWALDGGGALINQAIHTVDLLQHLAGPVEWVFGHAQRQRHSGIEAEDTAVAVTHFRSGAMGVIEASTALKPGASRRVELHGERGSVTLEGNDIREWHVEGASDIETQLAAIGERDRSDGASDPTRLDIAGHRQQIEDFVDAVRSGRAPMVDGVEGLRALAVVLAVYQSSREGRPVPVAEV